MDAWLECRIPPYGVCDDLVDWNGVGSAGHGGGDEGDGGVGGGAMTCDIEGSPQEPDDHPLIRVYPVAIGQGVFDGEKLLRFHHPQATRLMPL